MWIVKPGGSSRGRDIKVFNKLSNILKYVEIDVGVFNNFTENIQASPAKNPLDALSKNKPAESFAFSSKKNWVV